MQMTDEMKARLESAKTEEERKAIFTEIKEGSEKAGVLLEDEELEQVAGGSRPLPH